MGETSKAAGTVSIRAIEQPTSLSGFFVSDRFFLTCAHFQVTVMDEEEMRKGGSKMAFVSTKRLASSMFWPNIPKYLLMVTNFCSIDENKSAYLVFRDNDRDYAIFCLDSDQPAHPVHLDLNQHFPGVDRLDFETQLFNRRAFTIGYNTERFSEYLPAARWDIIDSLSPEKQDKVLAPTANLPDFNKIFCPGRKTLSVGRLSCSPPNTNEIMWEHRITGWYGISGAMIACLDNSSSMGAKVQVLGLCKITIHKN